MEKLIVERKAKDKAEVKETAEGRKKEQMVVEMPPDVTMRWLWQVKIGWCGVVVW